MKFKGLEKLTLLDYPGKLACIVFVATCNFRCPFCQNPDLVLRLEKLPDITPGEIFKFLAKRKGKLEGVVITGGEPTIYPDLPEFIKKIKDLDLPAGRQGYLVKLDTNGSNPEMVESLLNQHLLDYVAMDYKGPLKKYNQYIGVASQGVTLRSKVTPYKKTIKLLVRSGVEFELRTTVVPTLHSKEDLIKMAKEIKSWNTEHGTFNIKWYLQQFRPVTCLDKKFEKLKPYPKGFFDEILPEIKKILPETFLRGV